MSKRRLAGRDLTTPAGILLAMGCVVAMMMFISLSPLVIFKPGPIILVIGGAIFASAAGNIASEVRSLPKIMGRAVSGEERSPRATIERMVELARIARREGLLALDRESEQIEDPFFKKGLQMVVDGLDPDEVRAVLESEISSLSDRHRRGAKFFVDMGGLSPTLGILGTVIGLVKVLADIQNVNTVGPAIAGAFVATLWGVFMANLVWLPVANKLIRVNDLELASMELTLEGLLAIQAGSSPTRIEARLVTFLAPNERQAGGEAEEAA